MQDTVKLLKALADETRLRMLNMLFERECCVCEIIQVLGISQPRVSHHLGIMHNAGILRVRHRGLFSFYLIDWDNMDEATVDLLKSVRKRLMVNELSKSDLEKLSTVCRVYPECVHSS